MQRQMQSASSSKDSAILAFKEQQHSLRINISELAACAGFHPFKSLPQLFLNHVYQGRLGRELQKRDAVLLEIQIVSEEEEILGIARIAGRATREALQAALAVQEGEKKVSTVEEAGILQKKLVEAATKSGRLSEEQVNKLEEGARHSIYTGFGTSWETKALDLYQKQCGWEVFSRNSEIRAWDFDRNGKAIKPAFQAQYYPESTTSTIEDSDAEETEAAIHNTDSQPSVSGEESYQPEKITQLESFNPWFSLRGSVDGIRDEMVPSASTVEDDDSWVLRRVIVECKHRMRRIQPNPPIYEVIQAIAYCLMYQVEEADLVQVLRRENSSRKPKRKRASSHDINTSSSESNKIRDHFRPRSVDQNEKTGKTCEPQQPMSRSQKNTTEHSEQVDNDSSPSTSSDDKGSASGAEQEKANIEILAKRISINDPAFRHAENFRDIVLPRISSWTRAVYTVRRDDNKRYRFLVAISTEDMKTAWDILFLECQWLRRCNTSYSRDLSSKE